MYVLGKPTSVEDKYYSPAQIPAVLEGFHEARGETTEAEIADLKKQVRDIKMEMLESRASLKVAAQIGLPILILMFTLLYAKK